MAGPKHMFRCNPPEELDPAQRALWFLLNKNRMRLIALLAPGPMTMATLMTGIGSGRSNTQRHLDLLRAEGLVARKRPGVYELTPEGRLVADAVAGLLARAAAPPQVEPEPATAATEAA